MTMPSGVRWLRLRELQLPLLAAALLLFLFSRSAGKPPLHTLLIFCLSFVMICCNGRPGSLALEAVISFRDTPSHNLGLGRFYMLAVVV